MRIRIIFKFVLICIAVISITALAACVVPGNEASNINDAESSGMSAGQSALNSAQEEEQGSNIIDCSPALLESHLYGEWRFVELLAAPGKVWPAEARAHFKPNFTDDGVAQIISKLAIAFDENGARYLSTIDQTTFSSIDDVCLFGVYGGFYERAYPVYEIEEINQNSIRIWDRDDVEIEGAEKLYHITSYYNPETLGEVEYKGFCSITSSLYINPLDKDTIYLDFAGLWKMERVKEADEILGYSHNGDVPPGSGAASERDYEKAGQSSLNAEETELFEKHLQGLWYFAENIYRFEDIEGENGTIQSSISAEGTQDIKKAVRLSYSDDYVKEVADYDLVTRKQVNFSNAVDLYLFGLYGGFETTYNPDYQIRKNGSDTIRLHNICLDTEAEFELSGAENFYKVTFGDKNENPQGAKQKTGPFFGSVIYIDPNDTDSIYVEFAGLWKMKRVIYENDE